MKQALAVFVMHYTGIFPSIGKPMITILWCLAIGYRFGFTFLAGWITARLDPNQGMKATLFLTGIGCVLGLVENFSLTITIHWRSYEN
jgi:hypothetical protein